MEEALIALAIAEEVEMRKCGMRDPEGWEQHRSNSRLLFAQANEVREFGPVIAALRERVAAWMRLDRNRSYGVVFRAYKALEPKPLYATKRSICWSRFIAAEKRIQSPEQMEIAA